MKLVTLSESRMERQYKRFYTQGNINLALDNVAARHKRDYARELKLGYLRLLSNHN